MRHHPENSVARWTLLHSHGSIAASSDDLCVPRLLDADFRAFGRHALAPASRQRPPRHPDLRSHGRLRRDDSARDARRFALPGLLRPRPRCRHACDGPVLAGNRRLRREATPLPACRCRCDHLGLPVLHAAVSVIDQCTHDCSRLDHGHLFPARRAGDLARQAEGALAVPQAGGGRALCPRRRLVSGARRHVRLRTGLYRSGSVSDVVRSRLPCADAPDHSIRHHLDDPGAGARRAPKPARIRTGSVDQCPQSPFVCRRG